MRVGGLQTSALALAGADGRSYTFRPLIKDASKLIPAEFIGTPLHDLVQDQMSAQHSAGALVVPVLARALGVLESELSLVVMPDDRLLGEFREDYRGLLGTIAVYPQVCLRQQSRIPRGRADSQYDQSLATSSGEPFRPI